MLVREDIDIPYEGGDTMDVAKEFIAQRQKQTTSLFRNSGGGDLRFLSPILNTYFDTTYPGRPVTAVNVANDRYYFYESSPFIDEELDNVAHSIVAGCTHEWCKRNRTYKNANGKKNNSKPKFAIDPNRLSKFYKKSYGL